MAQANVQDARILIVDDEPINVLLLERMLEENGYTSLRATTDSRHVMALCEAQTPDLMLLDLMMPHRDGYEILEDVRQRRMETGPFPVVVLTADVSMEARRRALSAGASDFLTKPFDALEVLLRVKNLLENHLMYKTLQSHNETLEARVHERTSELERVNTHLIRTQLDVLDRLAHAAEYRDDDTGEHTRRVGYMAAMLAEKMGFSSDRVELIRRAAPLHDVGKIGIPDSILLKPSRLTAEEFDIMKSHAAIGAALLSNSDDPHMKCAEIIARTHHERWDGNGYPNKLQGPDIPTEGRIVSVTDVFDALTHRRPYKEPWPIEEAVTEIKNQSGRQFDPRVVEAFLELPHLDLV